MLTTPVSFHPQATERFLSRLALAVDAIDDVIPTSNFLRLQMCFRAVAFADFAAAAALMADDIEMELIGPTLFPVAGRWCGRDEVIAAAQANYGRLSDQRVVLLALAASGNEAILFAREQTRIRESGKLYDIHWSYQFTFRDGLIVRVRGLFSPSQSPTMGLVLGETYLFPATCPNIFVDALR
jgi:ketosteroid isomerase-like protein